MGEVILCLLRAFGPSFDAKEGKKRHLLTPLSRPTLGAPLLDPPKMTPKAVTAQVPGRGLGYFDDLPACICVYGTSMCQLNAACRPARITCPWVGALRTPRYWGPPCWTGPPQSSSKLMLRTGQKGLTLAQTITESLLERPGSM